MSIEVDCGRLFAIDFERFDQNYPYVALQHLCNSFKQIEKLFNYRNWFNKMEKNNENYDKLSCKYFNNENCDI